MSKFVAHYMLDALITSKTRIKLLVKFFLNPHTQSYLRELSSEFNESTNGIRLELNRLSDARLLNVSKGKNNTVVYKANNTHPLFNEIKRLVSKYTGIEAIVDNIIHSIGNLEYAFLVGSYAQGRESGVIEVLLIGEINEDYLKNIIDKVEKEIGKEISYIILPAIEHLEKEAFRYKMPLFAK